MNQRPAVLTAIDDIKRALRQIERLGWKGVDVSDGSRALMDFWSTAPRAPVSGTSESLESIRRDLGECRRCKLA
ncbi:MAG: hypothetical protein WAL90_11265, partial [Desulfobacterales bacterium]